MNQIDGISDVMLLLCGTVGGGLRKEVNGCCLASGALSRRKLSSGTHPDARHFSFSPYATAALQAAALVLEPRGSESV